MSVKVTYLQTQDPHANLTALVAWFESTDTLENWLLAQGSHKFDIPDFGPVDLWLEDSDEVWTMEGNRWTYTFEIFTTTILIVESTTQLTGEDLS